MADPYSLAEVRTVLAEHRQELLARFSGHGIGIGRPDPEGPYVITVYVSEPVPARPAAVEGVPVRLQPAGPFDAHR
ncbi:hypothetical protein ACNF49_29475 [Actinomadura sp. ATCC 39365]|uniref:hypothetical protein n=1 Tax=Nonomuraea sp. NPDC005692 TaxID=3157168 RepID=UPI003408E903